MSKTPLRMEPDQMKRLGYKVIDYIVDHFEHIKTTEVSNVISLEKASELFKEEVPEEPQDLEKNLEHIIQNGFSNILHTNHPRFFSFIPSPSNYVSVLADALAAGHNAFAGHWFSGGSSARIEMTCIGWLRDLLDFPESTGGIFTSGGSMANLMAIDVARKTKINGSISNARIYCSNQTHSSIAKGIKTLGFQSEQLIPIASNDDLQIDLIALGNQIKQDMTDSLTPFCIIGNAGTTNTGTVDDLEGIAHLAAKYNCWFHIDGAYGAAAYITDQGKSILSGMSLADSLTLDPHKWWFQPYEIGCLLVRDHLHLRNTYAINAEYLMDSKMQSSGEVNFYDYGIQLTRSLRALKFYLSIKTFGLKAFRTAIEHGIKMAEFAEVELSKDPKWQVFTPAQLGIISFRFNDPTLEEEALDKINLSIVQQMNIDGFASVISTTIHNRKVLRMVPIHPEVTKQDISQTINKLFAFGIYAKHSIASPTMND